MDELADPAVPVLGAAVLDVDQRRADVGRDLAGLAVAGDRLAAVPLERADRRDDRRRAAREHLGDRAVGGAVAPLVDADAPLVDVVAEVARRAS